MSDYISVGQCPYCGSGGNTGCYVSYLDGSGFCFTCKIFKKSSEHCMMHHKQARQKTNTLLENVIRDPKKFNVDNLKWLYKYYITEYDIYRSGIGELSNNLVFPIFDENGNTIFTQTRSIDKKFKTYGIKDKLFLVRSRIRDNNVVVIVEDYISAVRCSRYANTMCLFGTSVNKSVAEEVFHKYNKIIVWLDGDSAGRKASDNIMLIFNILQSRYAFENKSIVEINTTQDPKTYTNSEIARLIC